MSSHLQLHDVAYQLPHGERLFSNISGSFSSKVTALVGRNGVGKSLLAQILSGSISPTSGFVQNSDTSFYLPQVYPITAITTISDLLGITEILKALSRIEAGSVDPADFAQINDRWSIESDAIVLLARLSLSQYALSTFAHELSGGEQMRIRVAAAFLSDKTTLILDEPSNHLDSFHKEKLWEMIMAWRGKVILITHDRALLDRVETIAELTPDNLIWFTGSFSAYQAMQSEAKKRALERLNTIKQEEKKRLRTAQTQLERQQKRAASANRARGNQNQAKILMDAQKNRSDQTSGKMQRKYDRIKDAGKERIEVARNKIDQSSSIVIHELATAKHTRRIAAKLESIVLPFLEDEISPLSLTIEAGTKIAIVGNNGIGKSLLLKTIAGLIEPISGGIERFVNTLYLDQHLMNLVPDQSLLVQVSKGRTKEEISEIRVQLSQLGLQAADIEKESKFLSGGERLKSALALILYGKEPIDFLLLDEPNNHLDLESMAALEEMLRQYQGSLLVVSHDEVFLENIAISHYLTQSDGQWLSSSFS